MLPFHLSHAPRRGSWCERVFIVGPFSGPYSDCTWKSSGDEFPGVTHKGLSGCSLYHSYEFYLGLATNKSLAILSSARVHSFTVLRIRSGLTCASLGFASKRARATRARRGASLVPSVYSAPIGLSLSVCILTFFLSRLSFANWLTAPASSSRVRVLSICPSRASFTPGPRPAPLPTWLRDAQSDAPEADERLPRERLGEEVGHVVFSADKTRRDQVVLCSVA